MKIGRPKGSRNKVKQDLKDILNDNSSFLLLKALKLIDENPEKYVQLLSTLLTKIIPSQTINTNIDLTPQYLKQLETAKQRAEALLTPNNPIPTHYELIPEDTKDLKQAENTTSDIKDDENTANRLTDIQPTESTNCNSTL